MSDKFWYLKECRLFEQIAPEQLRELEMQARIRNFPRGSPVYVPSEAANSLLLVAKGQVKICQIMRDGRHSILCLVNPGEVFGELVLVGGRSDEEYAETTEPSTIVMIPATAIQDICDRNSHVALGVTKLVGLRVRRVERRMRNLLFQSNRQRLTHLLLELAENYGRKVPGDEIELALRLSHQDLASIIGSTRESVTLLLGQMQQEGLIRIQRKRIILRSLNGLRTSVADDAENPATHLLRTESIHHE